MDADPRSVTPQQRLLGRFCRDPFFPSCVSAGRWNDAPTRRRCVFQATFYREDIWTFGASSYIEMGANHIAVYFSNLQQEYGESQKGTHNVDVCMIFTGSNYQSETLGNINGSNKNIQWYIELFSKHAQFDQLKAGIWPNDDWRRQ